ncbi:MAG: alkaline phosphatase family protein [Candidatus Brocadiales bacterium]
MHIVAQGKIEISKWRYLGRNYEYVVGPNGTYDFSDEVKHNTFPLAAATAGPAPCYALIGKIGENGDTFLIGRDSVIEATDSGNVYLGVNDFDVADNRGDFYAKIDTYNSLPEEYVVKDTRKIEEGTGAQGKSVEDPNVLILYIDGLNYEVLTEMVYKGYMPNIKKVFFDGGINFPYTFTVYPSTTWTSTACALSSNFSDLTGIKSDAYLDKRVNQMRHFFTPYGPVTAARRMKPGVVGHIVDESPRKVVLPTIFDRAQTAKVPMHSSVLPVLFEQQPFFYDQSLSETLRIAGTHEIKPKFDEINTQFSIDYVIKQKYRIMYVWLPGADERSHESARGQWGESRKQLYLIDKQFSRMIDKLKNEGMYDKTYMFLYSDHGHIGGKDFINQNFDVTNDFFYESIKDMDGDGELDEGSGLGFNVQFVQHDEALHREHIDKSKEDFMAVGSMGYGAAVVYLPYKHKYSRNFDTNNSYYDLTHYQVYPTMKPVNVLDRLLKLDLSEKNKFPGLVANKPIDIITVPVTKDGYTTLVMNSQGLQALIEMRPTGNGKRDFEYRYRVITDFDQDQVGNNNYNTAGVAAAATRPSTTGTEGIATTATTEATTATTEVTVTTTEVTVTGVAAEDPFHYTSSPSFLKHIGHKMGWFNEFHSGREWLEATKRSDYPNTVVNFAHNTKWDDSIDNIRDRFSPDFSIMPKKGWNFQTDERLATDHGYPLFESVRVPLFVAGPNIKKGVVNTTPHLILDIMPTVMDTMGIEYPSDELDGKTILDIYEEETEEGVVFVRNERVAFYTDHGLPTYYPPRVDKTGYNMHSLDNPYDMHYLVANVAMAWNTPGVKIIDSITDVIIPGDPVRPLDSATTALGRGFKGDDPNNIFVKRTSQFVEALRIKQFSVSDGISMILFQFYLTQNNFHRANLLIDCIQHVGGDFNKLIGEPFFHGEKGLLPGQVLNAPIDGLQFVLNSTVRRAVEGATRLGYRAIFGAEHAMGAIHNTGVEKTWQTPEVVGRTDDSPFKMLDVAE